jgi:hypothetical protein
MPSSRALRDALAARHDGLDEADVATFIDRTQAYCGSGLRYRPGARSM